MGSAAAPASVTLTLLPVPNTLSAPVTVVHAIGTPLRLAVRSSRYLLAFDVLKPTTILAPDFWSEVMRKPPAAALNSLVSPVVRSVAVAVKYWLEKLPVI